MLLAGVQSSLNAWIPAQHLAGMTKKINVFQHRSKCDKVVIV